VRDAQGRPFVRVQTLGTAIMLCGEVRIGPTAGILFALLLRLTHAPGMQLGREALLESLWPGQPEAKRRANLRQALYKLRSHGIRVRVKGGCASIDAAQVVRTFAVERTAVRFERDVVAGQEPFGAFLPGFVSPCGTFEEWVQDEREAVHAEVRRVLVGQLRGRRERADWSGADVLARWLLQFDPLNEDATLTLAECTMLTGSKAEAIAILDRYLEELGPAAGDIRLPATQLRRRFSEPPNRRSLSFVATERHFVGRESVIAELTLSMRRARWRDGNAVLLHGASGIGKTRVTVELGKVAIVEGFRELRCDCCESDVTRPLSIFIDLLPELLLLPGALGCSPTSLAALRRLVPESPAASAYASSIAAANASSNTRATHGSAPSSATSSVTSPLSPLSPLLPMVDAAHTTAIGDATAESSGDAPSTLPFATPIAPIAPIASAIGAVHDALEDARQSAVTPLLPDGMSGDTLAPVFLLREPLPMVASLRRAIIDLLAAIADEKPIVIVVDDAHWMDAGSWDVLSDLIERMNGLRVFVLMMSRSPYGRPTRPERIPLALDVRPLAPLTPEASARLAALIASDMSALLNPMLSEWFVTTSEGSPLFLRALVNHWIETGDAGGIPPTLTQAIEQRLAKLSPDAMRTLQAMALLGVFASVDRLQRLLELPLHQLLSAIEELEVEGAMARSLSARVSCHELVGRGSINHLSGLMASTLHERIAATLSIELPSCSSAALLVRIAWHLKTSGNMEALQHFVLSHLDYFVQCGSPASSLRIIEALIVRSPDLSIDASVLRARTRLFLEAGEYGHALRENAQRATNESSVEALTDDQADEVLSAIDSSYRADALINRIELAEVAIKIAGTRNYTTQTRFRGAEIALVIASNEGDLVMATQAFNSCGIEHSIQERDDRAARVALLYHTIFGDRETSHRIAKRLVKLARNQEAATQRYHDLCRAGFALRFSGTLAEVAEAFRLGFETAQELGLPRLAQYAAWQLATVFHDAGKLQEAATWNAALTSLFASDDDEISSSFVVAHLCKLATANKEVERANELLAEYERRLPQMPTAVAAGFQIALQLGVRLLDPEWIPSWELVERATKSHRRIASVAACDYFSATLALSMSRAGELKAAKQVLDEYLITQRRELLPPSVFLRHVHASLASGDGPEQ